MGTRNPARSRNRAGSEASLWGLLLSLMARRLAVNRSEHSAKPNGLGLGNNGWGRGKVRAALCH
jgi:hypothetical protein